MKINLKANLLSLLTKKFDKPDLNFIKSDLNNLLKSKTLKDSVLIISQKYSLSRREVYNLGLEILKVKS